MISILIGLACAQTPFDDGALARLGAQKNRRMQLIQQVESVVALFEDAEQRLGIGEVAQSFVRGVHDQLIEDATTAREKFRSLSDEAAARVKEEMRNIYRDGGSQLGLRAMRNAERRISSLQGQLQAVSEEMSKLNASAHLQRLISENGGSVSQVFRDLLAQLTRSGDDPWDVLYPFHFVRKLWSGYRHEWYEKVLLTPVVLVGDLLFLPFQGMFWLIVAAYRI